MRAVVQHMHASAYVSNKAASHAACHTCAQLADNAAAAYEPAASASGCGSLKELSESFLSGWNSFSEDSIRMRQHTSAIERVEQLL
jgi:hypothetical protein